MKEDRIMKKTISNIRTLAALLMAGAAFAACSNSDDIINEQPVNPVKQGYTLTVSASKDGSTTRALSLEGTAVVASWETTDEIVVFSANGTQVGTLSPTNINGLEATFSGTISEDAVINVNDVLTLIYHPIPGGLDGFALQNGTLNGSATSAENFDMAVATVTISEISGKNIIVSESSANFVNQTAVVVLSPYNSAWSGYHSLKSLTVSVTMDIPEVGTVTEKIGPITVSGDQPHYFSLPSQALLAEVLAVKYSLSASAVSTLLASATVTFTGHQVAIYYLTCSKTGYKFAAGKYYKLDNSNFSMTMLDKYAAADKDVFVEGQDDSWSNTVTFAVNKEIGWKVVGDNVFCGDKQLYVVTTGMSPYGASEGWVKASDDFITFGATYSLREPEPAGPVTYTELNGGEVLHVGDIINPSEEICIDDIYVYMGGPSDSGSPYTVLRADFTYNEWGNIEGVNENADGNYYVIKSNTGGYFTFEGGLLGVTDTSDGILVTYTGEYSSWKNYKFTVHEP